MWLQVWPCNIKSVTVTAFFDCSTSERGEDAASPRGEEFALNITSKTQDTVCKYQCVCNDDGVDEGLGCPLNGRKLLKPLGPLL
jgi:hypothetical protein